MTFISGISPLVKHHISVRRNYIGGIGLPHSFVVELEPLFGDEVFAVGSVVSVLHSSCMQAHCIQVIKYITELRSLL